ncbi:MAG: FHA domain-containing protein [Planctomycetes bacterium]|nr:FHA domain-containing protein [Planctomycetota bacterium]
MKLEISGPDGKRIFSTRVGASLISAGRGTTCDIPLPKDAAVSDLHLRFNQFVGQWSVTDQFSDGGTFVNGEKIFSAELKVGDEIRAGGTTMRLTSLESSAIAEGGAAHSGKFEFTSAARPAAKAPSTPALRAATFESVSGDSLAWKDPAPSTNKWPESKPFAADKPATEELSPGEAAKILAKARPEGSKPVELTAAEAASFIERQSVAPPQGAGSVTADAPAWAPTRRDTERLKMQTVVRDKKGRQPKPAPEQQQSGRPPAGFSGTPDSVVSQPAPAQPARVAAPWEARQNTAFRQAASTPKPKKNSNVGGCIVALLIGGGIAIGILSDVLSSGNDSNSSRKANIVAPVNSWDGSPRYPDPAKPPIKETAPKWDSARQKQISARIKEIKDGLGTPSRKMDDLAALMETQPPDPPYAVTGSRDRAEIMLKYEINMALSKRLGDDQRDIWTLADGKRFDEALARLESLAAEAKSTKWVAEQAEKLEVGKYVGEKTATLLADNAEYIGKTLDNCDELAFLGCNELARAEFYRMVAGAHFDEPTRKGMEAELEALTAAAKANPGPAKAAKPTKPKVAATPKTGLTPDGGSTAAASPSKLRTRLMKAAAEPKMLNTPCKLYGRDVRLGGAQEGRLRLGVERMLPGPAAPMKYAYTLVRHALDLPPSTLATLYFAMPDADADHWLAVMLFCYDNGLPDDAARAAFNLNKLKPEARADLEAIMAAKLGMAPPEKGFVEKDGALVPG